MKNLSKYMSVKEFAAAVGISVQAVHKAIRSGRLKNYERIGFMFLISRNECKSFCKKNPIRKVG